MNRVLPGLKVLSRIAAGICAALLFSSMPAPASAGERVEVPVFQSSNGGRDTRFSIKVAIGRQEPIAVMLDTGSVGLRILDTALSDRAGVAMTNTPVQYGYGAGVQISGVVGTVDLGFGRARTSAPLPVQVVTKLGCNDKHPRCRGGSLPLSEYGFGGDGRPGAGFPAILGVSLARLSSAQEGIENPLRLVGDGRWILQIPRPSTEAPGRLILNPTEEEISGFTMYPLTGGNGAEIEACLLNERTRRSFCGPALLDTGAVGVSAFTSDVRRRIRWRRGTPGALSFGDGDGASGMRFVVGGYGPASRVSLSRPQGGEPPHLRPGVLPFYEFNVLYDPKVGAIGLQPRDDG